MTTGEHVYECPDLEPPKTSFLSRSKSPRGPPANLDGHKDRATGKLTPSRAIASAQPKESSKPAIKSFFLGLRSKKKKGPENSQTIVKGKCETKEPKMSSKKEQEMGNSGKQEKQKSRVAKGGKGKTTSTTRGNSPSGSRYKTVPSSITKPQTTDHTPYEEDDDLYTIVDEADLPPPPLPSREYLLDENFTQELATLEHGEPDSTDTQDRTNKQESTDDSDSDDSYIDISQAKYANRPEAANYPDREDPGMEEYVNVTTEGREGIESDTDSVDYEYMQPDDTER